MEVIPEAQRVTRGRATKMDREEMVAELRWVWWVFVKKCVHGEAGVDGV